MQVVTREGALVIHPEYVLRFQPPLTISNLLPVRLRDTCHAGHCDFHLYSKHLRLHNRDWAVLLLT